MVKGNNNGKLYGFSQKIVNTAQGGEGRALYFSRSALDKMEQKYQVLR